MLFIILQAVNLFEEKENNSSLPLATQHLGTGNACLIKVRGRTGKKRIDFCLSNIFSNIYNQDTIVNSQV